jgi:hypothetical protein
LALEAAGATSASPGALALNQATAEEPIISSGAIKLGLSKLDIDDIRAGIDDISHGEERKEKNWDHGEASSATVSATVSATSAPTK